MMDFFRQGGRPPGRPGDCVDGRPAWLRNGADVMLLGGGEGLNAVGESFYQGNLWRLANELPDGGRVRAEDVPHGASPIRPRWVGLLITDSSYHDSLAEMANAFPGGGWVRAEVTAVLVAEDDNPDDSNAIGVWIDGVKTGYLSREHSALYRPGLLALQADHEMPIALSGLIVGGGLWPDGPGLLGVCLRHDPDDFGISVPPGAVALSYAAFGLSRSDLDDARATYLTNYNHRSMNSGRGSADIFTVIRTGMFQDALQQAAAEPRPWRHERDRKLPAILARAPEDLATVAVLIDGVVVGYLSPSVADLHREQLDALARSGQYLVCAAWVVGGDVGKNFDVRLQIKPGIGRRWAAGARP